MKKIERNDWFKTGFGILETAGFGRITIDHLCSELKVTKGSFYHHFGNIDGYIEALMSFWMEQNTWSLIEKSEEFDQPQKQYEALHQLVLLRPNKPEQVIRGWSFSNDTVRKYVEKVDNLRIDHTADLLLKCGVDPHTARQTAMLEYACLIGLQQLFPEMSVEKLQALYRLYASGENQNK